MVSLAFALITIAAIRNARIGGGELAFDPLTLIMTGVIDLLIVLIMALAAIAIFAR